MLAKQKQFPFKKKYHVARTNTFAFTFGICCASLLFLLQKRFYFCNYFQFSRHYNCVNNYLTHFLQLLFHWLSLNAAMKPKVRDHYHSHRLSFWLHLIPKLHKPGEEDIYLRHHLLHDHENPQSYDGIVRQIAFKFLEPLPTAPTLALNNYANSSGNATLFNGSSIKYSKLHNSKQLSSTSSTFALSTPLSISTEQTLISSINGNNNNNKTTATAIVMNENSYTTALTITIVIGCSLLLLNILIFAGIYYQLNSAKHKRKKKIKNFEVSLLIITVGPRYKEQVNLGTSI